MLKLLAFDLDDTLYPEMKYIRSGFRAVSKYMQQKYKIDAKEFYKKLSSVKKQKPSSRVFDIVLKRYKIKNRSLIEELVKTYRAAPLHIKLFSGVKETLTKLKKNYVLALLTDGRSSVQNNKLKYLQLTKYFDTIVYTLDLGNKYKKPSVLPFKKMLEAHNIKARETLYIGNNPDKDFFGAKKIGIKTVRVNQGIFKGKITNKSLEADFTIKSIKELPSLISRINKK